MNDDLISRQAILKHIEKTRQAVQFMDDTHRASIIMNGMYLCEEAVRNQPSAQPERKNEPAGCNGCRYDWFGDPRCAKCSRSFQDHYEAERKKE